MAGELELYPTGTLTHVLGHQSDGQPRRVAAGTDLRGLAGAAALPQSGAGVGQFVNMTTTVNTAVVLPAGGTWKYALVAYTGTGAIAGQAVGIAAGGTTVLAANASNYTLGWAERIT